MGGRLPGLVQYRVADGRVTHFTKRDGLFNGFASHVLGDDDGNLWISTENGIANTLCIRPTPTGVSYNPSRMKPTVRGNARIATAERALEQWGWPVRSASQLASGPAGGPRDADRRPPPAVEGTVS